MNRITKNDFFQYLIAVIAACLVFGIMQGTKDNYGIMMNGIIEHTGISYAIVSFAMWYYSNGSRSDRDSFLYTDMEYAVVFRHYFTYWYRSALLRSGDGGNLPNHW